jgi:NAD-dependent deacetylase sirtuin 4
MNGVLESGNKPSEALAEFLAQGRVTVLTGAGVSTDSGIPDYRGPETARRARNPIRFQQFVTDPEWRQRYWSRSYLGWPNIRDKAPNACHFALHQLEEQGRVQGLITQNVDRLHAKAGHSGIELHGALAEVICLSCGSVRPREHVQEQLRELNPDFQAKVLEWAPDGDAELPPQATAGFRVQSCGCGGHLKPHVVFFGESVPRDKVEQAYAWVEQSQGLLVVGSSLTVFSGFRFVKRAQACGIPVAILTLGQTRGDPLAALKLEAPAGPVLAQAAQLLQDAGPLLAGAGLPL